MERLVIIVLLTAMLVVYGMIEYLRHQKHLKKIPIRIHVNGTRGKSSVTRLIGAGLRAGGFNTITKVTGTFPRMILNDGTEVVVHRKEKANILEQLNIVKFCSEQKADVLLIECMALQPNYQRITEHQMIKATHGVITNIRLDHLDVMGPGLEDVGKALSLTVPKGTRLFTAEDRMLGLLAKTSEKRKTVMTAVTGEEIAQKDMEEFTYFEHPENVALALSICESLGIDRSMALSAMKKTFPDEGALRRYKYLKEGKVIQFYNALAANDPESSRMIWDKIRKMEGEGKEYVALLNARKDRKDRSAQLVEMMADLNCNHVALTGENPELVENMAVKKGIQKARIIPIGQGEPSEQVGEILNKLSTDAIIVAFGNMGAGGAELSKYFELNHIA